MSIVVKDPKSNKQVAAGLVAANKKQNSIPLANRFLDPTTASALATNVLTFADQIVIMDSAESDKINLILLDGIAFVKLKKQGIRYLDTINGQIDLEVYPASVRKLFLMNSDSEVLPPMVTIADVLAVSVAIKSGNVKLIAMGLTPPQDFSAAQNDVLNTDYSNKAIQSNTATEVFVNAATVVAKSRIINRTLCTTIRKELQFKCIALEEPAMRDYCRLWGVVFQTKKEVTEIDILAIYLDGSGIAPGTVIRIGQVDTKATKKVKTPATQGVTGIADAHGTLDLETTQVGDLFLICNQVGCDELIVPITIEAGDDQSVTVHLVKSAPEGV